MPSRRPGRWRPRTVAARRPLWYPPELHVARTLAAPRVVNIADLRRLAERRLPRVVFDYIDGGAESEITLRENCRVFDQVTFRPRGAVAAPKTDLQTTVLGTTLALPFLLAPVGSTRMFYPRGEAVAAKAGGEAGTAYVLSTLSGCKLEEVKAATTGPCWYQVYLVGGREVTRAAIERARAAGFSALVVTIDTPVAGLRERDVRNGTKELVSRRPWTMLPFVWQFLERPGRRQGRAHGRRCAACRRRGRGSCRGVESRRAPAGWRGCHAAGIAGSGVSGARTGRGPDGWRHPPRERHRQGALPGRAGGPGGASLRLWPGRRRWSRRG